MNGLRQDPYTSMKGLRQSIQDETQESLPKDPADDNFLIHLTDDPLASNVPKGYMDDHFIPRAHPFTSVIVGPTGGGKTMFERRFVQNVKHMMMPRPDRIT